MNVIIRSRLVKVFAGLAAMLFLGTGTTQAIGADTGNPGGAALLAKYSSLKEELAHNPFFRPLHMESRDSSSSVAGEIFAQVAYPFATAAPALNAPAQWCEVLILNLNVKYCRPAKDNRGTVLLVSIGKKYDQPLEQAYRVEFIYRVVVNSPDYLQVSLEAAEGPLGTSNYHIVFEAVPTDAGHTFIRLAYSYSFGMVGHVAMEAYLGTIGRNKVGFTVTGREPDGQPRYIGGMRGVVERNTMRYYLAIEAYLGSLASPPPARMEKSLRDWFNAIERYPRQLHEMEQGEYLEMKRKEVARQRVGVVTGALLLMEAKG